MRTLIHIQGITYEIKQNKKFLNFSYMLQKYDNPTVFPIRFCRADRMQENAHVGRFSCPSEKGHLHLFRMCWFVLPFSYILLLLQYHLFIGNGTVLLTCSIEIMCRKTFFKYSAFEEVFSLYPGTYIITLECFEMFIAFLPSLSS